MVEPTQYRDGDHSALLLRWRSKKRWRIGNALPKPLMWSSLIEGDHNRLGEAGRGVSRGRSGSDQDMLVSRSRESVRHLACARGVRYGVRRTLMPLVAATRAQLGPNFLSFSRISSRGPSPYGVASRSGTGDPGIGRRSGHIHLHDLARLRLDDEEGNERTEKEIRDLQEITDPHLCHLSAQERFPALSTGSKWHESASSPFGWSV